jgi:carbonic anhydrase
MSLIQQSPINLTKPIVTDFGKDGLDIKLKSSAHGTVKKDEHGAQIVFGGDERQFIVLGRKKFHLVQFHFHHPSEHWIDGKQQTLELHIVHQNIDDGARAVLGVFVDFDPSATIAPSLVPHIVTHLSGGSIQPTEPVATNPLEWLPADTSKYYRYEALSPRRSTTKT